MVLFRLSVSLSAVEPVKLSSPLGTSLTCVMLMLIACLVVPPRSSVMEMMKESLPLKSALGV